MRQHLLVGLSHLSRYPSKWNPFQLVHGRIERSISYSCIVRRSLSSTSEAASVEDILKKRDPKDFVWKPLTLFPWRHQTEILMPPNFMSRNGNEKLTTRRSAGSIGENIVHAMMEQMVWITSLLLANKLLRVPLRDYVFSGWRNEFAESSSWAFVQAVSAIMYDVYGIPIVKDTDVDTNHLSIQHTLDYQQASDHPKQETIFALDSIIEKKLLSLYQSAHASGRDQLQVHLDMKPTSSELLGLVCIPCFTREDFQKDPTLRTEFRSLYEAEVQRVPGLNFMTGNLRNVQESYSYFNALLRLFEERFKRGGSTEEYLSFTVMAHVVVYCDEIFSVTDTTTGVVLQGHGDGKVRPISHLVQLEAVGKMRFQDQDITLQDWQITDWDRLLGGNFFLA
jgi:hypothetical protein